MDPGKEHGLLFVYNADSGTLEAVKDYLHKITSPSNYQCRLCAVTYGNVGMKKEWREFLDQLPIGSEFIHRDEFRERYPSRKDSFPAVFLRKEERLDSLITSEMMERVDSLEGLMDLVGKEVERIQRE
jgi:hypothetical protein